MSDGFLHRFTTANASPLRRLFSKSCRGNDGRGDPARIPNRDDEVEIVVVNCPSDLTVRLGLDRQALLVSRFGAHVALDGHLLSVQTDVPRGNFEQFGHRPSRQ